MNKEEIITAITNRILKEQRKHSTLDQAQIAARKIYSSFIHVEINCGTCKHREVSKYIEPCYGCRDTDEYLHWKEKEKPQEKSQGYFF